MLTPEFHRGRRALVLAALSNSAVAILFAGPQRTRENDVLYEYRQDSDLYYLTGMSEPNSVLILAPAGIDVDGELVRELLFVPPRDPTRETWTGRRLGDVRAERILGIEKAVTTERFEEIIRPLLESRSRPVYHLPLPAGIEESTELGSQVELLKQNIDIFPMPTSGFGSFVAPRMLVVDEDSAFGRLQTFVKQRVDRAEFAQSGLEEMYDAFLNSAALEEWRAWRREHIDARYADGITLRRVLNKLRSVKTEEELVILKRAIDITAMAHREAMRSIEPGMHEYEVEALIEYVFHREGAEHPGFPSIVGSGENSVIPHYETNRRQMEAGDVVVIDIGAEYHGYSADVTRTVPVDGVFSPEQRAIYEIVLRAQAAGIEEARAGRSFGSADQAARAVVAEGLLELGLIESEVQARRFFIHGTSHYLGLYVHDVGLYGALEPGNVITVEPGIYIPAASDIEPRWWNIGVRIEDDVLITDSDPVVLSAGAPRTVEAIETLMKETGVANEPTSSRN